MMSPTERLANNIEFKDSEIEQSASITGDNFVKDEVLNDT